MEMVVSRDFTFINNVIQMNILALTTDDKIAINQVYNTAVGERTTLIEMFLLLKKYLSNMTHVFPKLRSNLDQKD